MHHPFEDKVKEKGWMITHLIFKYLGLEVVVPTSLLLTVLWQELVRIHPDAKGLLNGVLIVQLLLGKALHYGGEARTFVSA